MLNSIFYILIFIIIVLLAILLKNKNIVITIIFSLIIIQIIITPKLCIDGVISGASLFFYKVFPSLFSFLIVCNIIMAYDGVHIYSKLLGKFICKPLKLPINCSFVLIVSVLCGYPLGAKYACQLYENKIINTKTCERLINIASNGSPLFILGSVGISMLKNDSIGYILLLSNILSCIAMAFIVPSDGVVLKDTFLHPHNVKSQQNIGNVLKSSVESSIKNCLSIGGFVTLFSVANNIIKNNILFHILSNTINNITKIPLDAIQGFILGIIEMTNGCNLISETSLSLLYKIAIISFLFTFSGLSIISQVYSFTYKFDISMKTYVFRKLIQGVICSLITIFLYKIFFYHSLPIISSFNNNADCNHYSTQNLILLIYILFLIPWILSKLRSLFHIS
ncbi:sporulation integral membrane protein YlbJ [Clostridium fermenticellae]|uniref:Sporulation integral membrane protein YlbJ n=1 Tax=Clostridium fermenticellae TaxID=2068654 RepID=A0A386H2V1_9CLOT|nr:sporulation integral membrane protein YlbJ [Clostridium fermenticellae]AYD40029.1 sporulation integral membrane protein YlbJ [Clostridium fermenticellae]